MVKEEEREGQPHLGPYQGGTATEMEEDHRIARGKELRQTLAAAHEREHVLIVFVYSKLYRANYDKIETYMTRKDIRREKN